MLDRIRGTQKALVRLAPRLVSLAPMLCPRRDPSLLASGPACRKRSSDSGRSPCQGTKHSRQPSIHELIISDCSTAAKYGNHGDRSRTAMPPDSQPTG
ncbi:hypothetical protein [Streptomyces abyssalis]|uniref:hypothetical protein n=1 Tax=Streptomyces abyssalis TaxID=933944 RepID=UPI0011130258|nr:hypothetical protein [Streptomyces abyssalis]